MKRTITSYHSNITDNETKKIADLILEEFEQESFHRLFIHLQPVTAISQIFLGSISHLASDDITDEIYYKIHALELFMKLLILEISEKPLEFPIDLSKDITLNSNKFKDLQDQLHPIKKADLNQLTL